MKSPHMMREKANEMASGDSPDRAAMTVGRLLLSIPGRLRKNPDFIRAFGRLLFPRSEQERETALTDLNVWLLRKQIEIETSGALEAAKGFARQLLESNREISAHAEAVPHLGALAPLAPLPATRFDYARLLLRVLLELKEQQPGLGLATSNFGISHGARSLSGLEIAQSWALLGSYGHLFGTFSTERGLLFALDADPNAEHRFLTQIAPEVRTAAEGVVRARDLYRMFYVLAAWRVSRWGGSPMRQTCLALLEKLLASPSELPWRRLAWAFRRARQLSYSRLHTMLGVPFASTSVPVERAVRELRPLPQIGFIDEAEEVPGAVLGLVEALDRFYGEEFFTSPSASASVLAHLREFKRWWTARASIPLEDRIQLLMSKPADWPSAPFAHGEHFVRLEVPDGGAGWTNEVRRWMDAPAHVWQHANFLITPSRAQRHECSVIDVYTSGAPTPAVVERVASLLAERNEGTWLAPTPAATSKRLWRSVSAFGLSLFQLLLNDGLLAHLEPVAAQDGIGLALLSRTVVSGCGRLADFTRRVEDDGRRRELDALRQTALTFNPQGVWFAFLGRLRILDRTSGRAVQELDGAFASIGDARVEWHFIEHKDGDAGGMKVQLGKLDKHLRVPVPPCDEVEVPRGRAAHAQVTWRG